ncbi:CarD family transcriptional regulator [Parasporobacterium paucivorans]|uniref:Transcriptional regulator, CarD family n=1 Tax=Parasporobacterium paucivorans DSM 15970 TaxID=1122934 RepID=A0A1M6IKQ4_9FIRM|nr:CarD family transcriptional regulator [Parasporobacterium paucivorans]SHJ34963.1 transcriptional regulator, CarD family [Parasporobacterium paucivorans DSM 15970]
MYQKNDYIVYGSRGVCQIVGIGIPEVSWVDKDREYYMLKPVYSSCNIVYIPVDNEKIMMRKILSRREARELIDNMDSIEPLYAVTDKILEEKYKVSLAALDTKELVKIIKTVYVKKQDKLKVGKKLGQTDERYLKKAEELLFGEMSLSLEVDKDDVAKEIEDRVRNAFSRLN